MQFNKKEVDDLFAKVDRGIYEYRKARLVSFFKTVWTVIFAVTMFPLLLLRDWFFSDRK